MNIKKDLLAEIEAKANKIKQRKNKAKSKTELETLVFDFFEETEQLSKMKEFILIYEAVWQLQRKVNFKIDPDARVEAVYTQDKEVSGVIVYWSKSHQVANKSEEQIYIGVEQMLFS